MPFISCTMTTSVHFPLHRYCGTNTKFYSFGNKHRTFSYLTLLPALPQTYLEDKLSTDVFIGLRPTFLIQMKIIPAERSYIYPTGRESISSKFVSLRALKKYHGPLQSCSRLYIFPSSVLELDWICT